MSRWVGVISKTNMQVDADPPGGAAFGFLVVPAIYDLETLDETGSLSILFNWTLATGGNPTSSAAGVVAVWQYTAAQDTWTKVLSATSVGLNTTLAVTLAGPLFEDTKVFIQWTTPPLDGQTACSVRCEVTAGPVVLVPGSGVASTGLTGKYNANRPTLSDGDESPLQIDDEGRLYRSPGDPTTLVDGVGTSEYFWIISATPKKLYSLDITIVSFTADCYLMIFDSDTANSGGMDASTKTQRYPSIPITSKGVISLSWGEYGLPAGTNKLVFVISSDHETCTTSTNAYTQFQARIAV